MDSKAFNDGLTQVDFWIRKLSDEQKLVIVKTIFLKLESSPELVSLGRTEWKRLYVYMQTIHHKFTAQSRLESSVCAICQMGAECTQHD